MPGRERLSEWQVAVAFAAFLIGNSALYLPMGPAGRDAWISGALAAALGVGETFLLIRLANLFPGKLPAEYFREAAGRYAGPALAAAYIWFSFHIGTLLVAQVTEIHLATVFVETPPSVLTGSMVLLVGIAIYLGIEVTARATEVILPGVVLSLASIGLAALATRGLIRIENFLPILERGIVPVLKGAWMSFVFPWGEAVVLLSVMPYAHDGAKLGRWAIGATVFAGMVLILVQLRNIAVLGERASKMLFPSLVVVQMINVGELLQRLDSLALFSWTFSAFTRLCFALFAAAVNLRVILGVRETRTLVFPLAGLMAGVSSTLFRSSADLADFVPAYAVYALPFEVLIPVIVLVLGLLRRRRKSA